MQDQDINANFDSPLILKISFDKVLSYYERLAQSDDSFLAQKANRVLQAGSVTPKLRTGFSDPSLLLTYHREIEIILEDSFSGILTQNEIKTASMPLHDLIFNASARFRSILKNAGDDFKLKITNMPENDLYRVACILILYFYYDKKLSFKRPLFYEIPDEKGLLKTYKILYNTEFAEVIKTESAPELTEADFTQLLDNFWDIELWRQKFPPQSYIFKGFTINNIFNVTDDRSISDIKSTLLVSGKRNNQNFTKDFQTTFEALFDIKDLKIGFVIYDRNISSLKRVDGNAVVSYLLPYSESVACDTLFCSASYTALISENNYFAISDVERSYQESQDLVYKNLYDQGIRSAIFVPLSSQGHLLGVLEIVSHKTSELNSVNANVLEDVMPFLVSSLLRSKEEEEHLIEAVIQQECTSIHPSVAWKFEDAARLFLDTKQVSGKPVAFEDIIFENVHPLFGQIDVKKSAETRNEATRQDILMQLDMAKDILESQSYTEKLPIHKALLSKIDTYEKALSYQLKSDDEQRVNHLFKMEIHPLFSDLKKKNREIGGRIESYFSQINTRFNLIYYYRKDYDDTISLINKNMSRILDQKQVDAQLMYPHYFERYKTDGVEHNMYVGESITKQHDFHKKYLYNLQLWQLQVMCDMENTFYKNKRDYPASVDVASMVLVYHQPLSIQFRMDEKRFDVYGSFNARYEVIKKRVDKALVKGTSKRVTESGKLTIIYAQKEDEVRYLRYIKFLQTKNILGQQVELLELEGLQGVIGLKAIRVPIRYNATTLSEYYKYEDLITQEKS